MIYIRNISPVDIYPVFRTTWVAVANGSALEVNVGNLLRALGITQFIPTIIIYSHIVGTQLSMKHDQLGGLNLTEPEKEFEKLPGGNRSLTSRLYLRKVLIN